MIGTHYRHMTADMQARVVAAVAERLAVALAAMPQVCPKPGSAGDAGGPAWALQAADLGYWEGGAEGDSNP
jgi:hypothetical protein